MAKKPDGGPAFPIGANPGMTLRDYFAAQAMQSMMGLDTEHHWGSNDMSMIAEKAWNMADAMLEWQDGELSERFREGIRGK